MLYFLGSVRVKQLQKHYLSPICILRRFLPFKWSIRQCFSLLHLKPIVFAWQESFDSSKPVTSEDIKGVFENLAKKKKQRLAWVSSVSLETWRSSLVPLDLICQAMSYQLCRCSRCTANAAATLVTLSIIYSTSLLLRICQLIIAVEHLK